MSDLTCQVWTVLIHGAPHYFGVVRRGRQRLWKGKPSTVYADAVQDAERAATKIWARETNVRPHPRIKRPGW